LTVPRCRIVSYLNNIVEQDRRSINRRVNASLGFRSFDGAQRTIEGYEVMHMIRKAQVRWLSKDDIAAQVRFIQVMFGVAAELLKIRERFVVSPLFVTLPSRALRRVTQVLAPLEFFHHTGSFKERFRYGVAVTADELCVM
jgi:DDE domain